VPGRVPTSILRPRGASEHEACRGLHVAEPATLSREPRQPFAVKRLKTQKVPTSLSLLYVLDLPACAAVQIYKQDIWRPAVAINCEAAARAAKR